MSCTVTPGLNLSVSARAVLVQPSRSLMLAGFKPSREIIRKFYLVAWGDVSEDLHCERIQENGMKPAAGSTRG